MLADRPLPLESLITLQFLKVFYERSASVSINARKRYRTPYPKASFSGIGKPWTGSFSKRRGSTPASAAASGKRERRAKRRRERARVKGKKNGAEREQKGVRREIGRVRAKSGGMSLVSSCLHKAAPHQIAFVLNIWIGGYGPSAIAGRDATRKRERERIQYPISYARTTLRPSRTYDKERERKDVWSSGQKQDGTRAAVIRRNSFPRYSPVSGANTPTPSALLPNLPNESALRPSFLSLSLFLTLSPSLSLSLRPNIGFPIT